MSERLSTQRRRYRMGDPLVPFIEGNAGALKVFVDLDEKLQGVDFWTTVLDLDDMNIRGSQIWVAYKDACGQDLDTLIRRVRERDPELAAAINREMPDGEQAVTHGATYAHL